jgi:hypothetical protein
MKKIIMIGIVILVLMSFGCMKQERPETFRVVSITILDVVRMSDGRVDVLFRPTFEYSNSSVDVVIIDEYWKINGEGVRINDYETLIPTDGAVVTIHAKYALRHVFPKGTTDAVISGFFTAIYPFGNIIDKIEETKIPITW